MPIISAFRWDTGVQAHWETPAVDVTAGVTAGTLSDPQGSDNNGGKQVSGRVAVRPVTGLVLGASARTWRVPVEDGDAALSES